MTHTRSLKNPPADALAELGRESRRAYERDWHIWTEQEIDDYTVAWGIPRTVAEMCLNFQQLEAAACRHINMENLGELAQAIAEWGLDSWAAGQMAERERNQEQGE